MVLSTLARADVVYLIDYMRKAQLDHPLDHLTADLLSRHHVEFGYDSQIKMMEDLRDLPVVTLLSMMLHLSDT